MNFWSWSEGPSKSKRALELGRAGVAITTPARSRGLVGCISRFVICQLKTKLSNRGGGHKKKNQQLGGIGRSSEILGKKGGD